MRVKQYVVETMPEAMLQIRKDLGSDAVILSTKEIKVGGVLGMFRKKRIEVVAAVDKEEKNRLQINYKTNFHPYLAHLYLKHIGKRLVRLSLLLKNRLQVSLKKCARESDGCHSCV